MDNRKTCAGCSHYRHLCAGDKTSEMVCHYSIDTDRLRNCPAAECQFNDHEQHRRRKEVFYASACV